MRGMETQRMKRCRNNNKLSTFISMEQFNVKWKIRQESIFHNSMLGCCSRTVITYTQPVNFLCLIKMKLCLAGLNWNHRKFYILVSFHRRHRRRRAKLIDLIKQETKIMEVEAASISDCRDHEIKFFQKFKLFREIR